MLKKFSVIAMALCLIGCGADDSGKSDYSALQSTEDLNTYLNGKTYRSTDRYEVGLGESGVVLGHWSIIFDDNRFTWFHSDYAEIGTYSYINETNFLVEFTNTSFSAEILFENSEMIWDDISYEQIPE